MRAPHHARVTSRRRAVLVAVAIVAVAGATGGLAVWQPWEPERVCVRPENLRTRRGVTLIAEAMEAFVEAERMVGQEIVVVQSFRSCRAQARACRQICGNRRGCPGLCAPPGLSWHQRGLAIDIAEASLEDPGVVDALEGTGWCQSVPRTDPGHFSFDGCH